LEEEVGKFPLKDGVNFIGPQGLVSTIQHNAAGARNSAFTLGGTILWPTLQFAAAQEREAIDGALDNGDSLSNLLTLQRELPQLILRPIHNQL
jgi:hypothetical protein